MKQTEKLTAKEFIKRKNLILKTIELFKKDINKKRYTPLHNKYVIENSPVSIGKVYEIVGRKNRRFKRFVVYSIQVETVMDRFVFIEVLL